MPQTGSSLAANRPAVHVARLSKSILLILKEGAHIVVPASCSSEAVSEAPPAEEFPGFAWTPGVERYMTSRSYAAKRAYGGCPLSSPAIGSNISAPR